MPESLFHMSVKTVSRANGRSAQAAAAYRAGCSIKNNKGETLFDYSKRKGVVHSQIIAGKYSPNWVFDRNKLWAAACEAEIRKNSVEAREFEVAIPKELNKEQSIDLVCRFSKELVEKHKFVADFAIHSDSETNWSGVKKDFNGFHAHILCTTRRINQSGFQQKTRELDDQKSGFIDYWRARWANMANEYMQKLGIKAYINHQSHKSRGIIRKPTIHLGHQCVALERRKHPSKLGDINRKLISSYITGVVTKQLRPELIDTSISVAEALLIRDKVNQAEINLIQKAKQLANELDFAEAVIALTNELENEKKVFTPTPRKIYIP